MNDHNNSFLAVLSKTSVKRIPIYCTGYPKPPFISNYCEMYNIPRKSNDLRLMDNNYSVIQRIGFDAISIWDFRRSPGGYYINDNQYVDGWGRIYRNNWYSWNGVFKSQVVIDNWKYLKLPSSKDLKLLQIALKGFKKLNLIAVLSLPGLFEKTWQSMGFVYFSQCLRKGQFSLLETIIEFFFNYTLRLLKILQQYNIDIFIIADDLGYKNRVFIKETLWRRLFFSKYQAIIQQAHQKHDKNGSIILHSDGDITTMMDVFIELGFDAIQSLEPDAGVDIFTLLKKYANDITFIGNVSNTLLSFGTPEDVKRYMTKLISTAKQYNASLIISPTQQIDSAIKLENIKTLLTSNEVR